MPARQTPLVNDYYYHLFNRSVAKVPIFTSKNDYSRAMDLLNYYRFKNTPFPFSKFKRLARSQRDKILENLENKADRLVNIVCFCLMPNHFHLLLRQLQDEGIIIFLGNLQNSYAKYFNTKYERNGSLFQDRFKAVLLEDESQFLHVNRYIHLNPYSSLIVGDIKDLRYYQWSSFPQYLSAGKGFCQTGVILGQFKSRSSYSDFVFDQADYQKNLKKIKHLAYD